MTTFPAQQTAVSYLGGQLQRLRRQIRGWLWWSGLSRWLWLVVLMLVADMVLDRVFRMDFAQRSIVAVLMGGTALYYWLRWIARPLTRYATDRALLEEVETRAPDARRRLITAWELSQQTQFKERGVSPELALASVQTGLERAQQLDFTAILNRPRDRRQRGIAYAAGLLLLGLGWGVWQTEFLRTWFRRNVMLTNDQWPLDTQLELIGAVDGKIIVPRGLDYRQVVQVNPSSRISDVEVSLEMEANGARTIQKMKPTGREGGREHSFVFHSIATEYRLRARGGDGLTDWVNLELVEPPAVLAWELQEILPAYTEREPQTISLSEQVKILNGSQLSVTVQGNKPLRVCRLKSDAQTWELAAVDEERQRFSIQIGDAAHPAVGGRYLLELVDDSGLSNIREFGFTLKTAEDRPPVARGNLLGISGLVVPQAQIPVGYNLEDDFGLTQLIWECTASAEEQPEPRTLTIPAQTWDRRPPQTAVQDVAVLALERLKVTPGTSLRLTLLAEDNKLPQPGLGRSRDFLLRVVTEEELRADLLRREIEQRKAFQMAYDAQLELISELRQIAAAPTAPQTPEELANDRQKRLGTAYRAQRGISTSVDLVAGRFDEFLVEVANNRLDEETRKIDPTRTLQHRFEQEIIIPIRQMDETLIAAANRGIDNCLRTVAAPADLSPAVENTVAIQEQILDRMRQILASMESSESFQETVNRLLEIKRIEEGVRKQLENQGNSRGIFDDDQ